MFEPWKMAAMDESGAFGIRQKHIDTVAEEITRLGIAEVSRQDFDRACWSCHIDPSNFTQADLDRLQAKRMNSQRRDGLAGQGRKTE